MKGLEIASYTKGFYDGMSCNQHYPQSLMVMGYKLEQIIELITKAEDEKFMTGAQWTKDQIEQMQRTQKEVNRKYEWVTPDTKSDKQFLQWIWARLHQVFGERDNLDYMKRLDTIINKMPGNRRLDIVDDGNWDIYRKGQLIHSDPE